MGANSAIEWTQATWNPMTGCTKISPGCANCYAERMSYRLQAMGQPNYAAGFEIALHPNMLQLPLKWKKPQMIFVNSMSDLFHEQIPADFILQVFHVMQKAHWHTFQVLTKRSERLRELNNHLPWPSNVWMGVTVENNACCRRVADLRVTGAKTKFLSLEPLLGPLPNLDLTGINWAVIGGESGPGARVMKEEWVLDIRDKCRQSRTAFFFKQWGGINKKKAGRTLAGRTWDELPVVPSPQLTAV